MFVQQQVIWIPSAFCLVRIMDEALLLSFCICCNALVPDFCLSYNNGAVLQILGQNCEVCVWGRFSHAVWRMDYVYLFMYSWLLHQRAWDQVIRWTGVSVHADCHSLGTQPWGSESHPEDDEDCKKKFAKKFSSFNNKKIYFHFIAIEFCLQCQRQGSSTISPYTVCAKCKSRNR